jgi:ribosome maturation factor RimP
MAAKQSSGGVVSAVVQLAEPLAEQLGLLLWDVRFVKEGASWVLRVIIDKEEEAVSINDCVDMTHLLNPVLDEADPIEQSYCLEVCSPGIERELLRPEHFAYCLGWPVRVGLFAPIDGQREIAGILVAYDGGDLTLENEEGACIALDKKAYSSVRVIDDGEDAEEE